MDMWVGTRSAWHSKSLERRCQTAVCMFPGCYYTRFALRFALITELMTGFTHTVQTEATCLYVECIA